MLRVFGHLEQHHMSRPQNGFYRCFPRIYISGTDGLSFNPTDLESWKTHSIHVSTKKQKCNQSMTAGIHEPLWGSCRQLKFFLRMHAKLTPLCQPGSSVAVLRGLLFRASSCNSGFIVPEQRSKGLRNPLQNAWANPLILQNLFGQKTLSTRKWNNFQQTIFRTKFLMPIELQTCLADTAMVVDPLRIYTSLSASQKHGQPPQSIEHITFPTDGFKQRARKSVMTFLTAGACRFCRFCRFQQLLQNLLLSDFLEGNFHIFGRNIVLICNLWVNEHSFTLKALNQLFGFIFFLLFSNIWIDIICVLFTMQFLETTLGAVAPVRCFHHGLLQSTAKRCKFDCSNHGLVATFLEPQMRARSQCLYKMTERQTPLENVPFSLITEIYWHMAEVQGRSTPRIIYNEGFDHLLLQKPFLRVFLQGHTTSETSVLPHAECPYWWLGKKCKKIRNCFSLNGFSKLFWMAFSLFSNRPVLIDTLAAADQNALQDSWLFGDCCRRKLKCCSIGSSESLPFPCCHGQKLSSFVKVTRTPARHDAWRFVTVCPAMNKEPVGTDNSLHFSSDSIFIMSNTKNPSKPIWHRDTKPRPRWSNGAMFKATYSAGRVCEPVYLHRFNVKKKHGNWWQLYLKSTLWFQHVSTVTTRPNDYKVYTDPLPATKCISHVFLW